VGKTAEAAAIALAALALGGGPARAAPAHVTLLKRLSGATPFLGGCGVPGDETPSSEAEPSLAVDPQNPEQLVATWQQDRFPGDGGALSNLVASSSDGGRGWRTTRLPGLSRCTGGSKERTSDPWVSIGPDSRTYLSSLTFTETPAGLVGAAGPTAQSVSVSTDGGRNFGGAVSIADRLTYDDREAVTADPGRPGHAYVAWVLRYGVLGESGAEQFVRTTDRGRSWSPPRTIYAPSSGNLPDPTLVNVLPDGTLLNTFLLANGTPVAEESISPAIPLISWTVYAMRSTNEGRTWSASLAVGVIRRPVAPHDPDSGSGVRAFPVISTAVARDGTAYVVWNEITSDRLSRVLIARSRDGGRSWSSPTAVARVTGQAFVPSVAVAPFGTVGVTWDDTRRDRAHDAQLTGDVWFAHSHDHGRSFRQTHVAGPFDLLTGPRTSSTSVAGRFIGDYQGMVALRKGFGAAFAQTRPRARFGPSDMFFARLRVGRVPSCA
jgi:hypothetical protein